VKSVVEINVTQQVPNSGYSFGGGLPFGFNGGGSYTQQAEGSGFVWDTSGHIVTNYHVVKDATTVDVVFSNGTDIPAKVVGQDPGSDLAVIQLEPPSGTSMPNLTPLPRGNSSQLNVGQMVLAIGNPFSEQFTMTKGIVSAVGRSIQSQAQNYSIPNAIQTDAAINPGNSGGPLLDRNGNVVGINDQIITQSGQSSGVGFAIPIDLVKNVVPSLIQNGKYQHPWLGVSISNMSSAIAQAMNLPANTRGALVMSVVSGGPADQAGLHGSTNQVTIQGQPVQVGGDVITAFNGKPVNTIDQLIALTDSSQPGQQVTLTIIRNGNTMQKQVTLGQRPATNTTTTG
ncbi:MAG TPA: trypsin-like peptidase domain-containing protein, partial [Candidatus Krumholzibacteria bacterium]|nr:trypsin-like peptidase domain-containing protein [Candidatus Krumholzibacteria bacterium]